MNFQEFLAAKRALQLVEHMDTLSESDALELFNSLDEETINYIEQVLGEGSLGGANVSRKDRGVMKRLARAQAEGPHLPGELEAAQAAAEANLQRVRGAFEAKIMGSQVPRALRRRNSAVTEDTSIDPPQQIPPGSTVVKVGDFGSSPKAPPSRYGVDAAYRRLARRKDLTPEQRETIRQGIAITGIRNIGTNIRPAMR